MDAPVAVNNALIPEGQSATQEMLMKIAFSDPSVSFSMLRNLGYRSPASNKSDNEYDVIFEVGCMVRTNPDFVNDFDGTPAAAVEYVYGCAAERMWLWFQVAVAAWEGKYEYSPGDTRFNLEFALPPRPGAANIVVYGGVVDKAGRYLNLTVTDQTTAEDAFRQLPFAFWMYDAATKLGHNEDFAPFGVRKVMFTTAIEQVYAGKNRRPSTVAARKDAINQGGEDDGEAPAKPRSPATPFGRTQPRPKTSPPADNSDKAAVCETMNDLKALDRDVLFRLKIGRIALIAPKTGGNSMMVFNGYVMGAENTPTLDKKDNVFMHSNRRGYDALLDDLKKIGVTLDLGTEHNFPAAIEIQGIKKIGNSGSPYYDQVRLVATAPAS